MAFSAGLVWEIRPGQGASTNGGAFRSGATGTDYSQQSSPAVAFADLVIGATTTELTSAAFPFGAEHVGNVINITAGTGFTTGRYEILSVAGNVATMDRDVGTAASTGGAGRLGGAINSLEYIATIVVAGNKIYLKNTGTADGVWGANRTLTSGTIDNPVAMIGYNLVRGDLEAETWAQSHNSAGFLTGTNYPVINCGSYVLTLGTYSITRCFNITSARSGASITAGYNCSLFRIMANNTANAVSAYGYAAGVRAVAIDCDFSTSGSSSAASIGSNTDSVLHACRISSVSGHGIASNTSINVSDCLFFGIPAGKAAVYNTAADKSVVLINCTFYNCAGDGVQFPNLAQTTPMLTLINCVAVNCGNIANNTRNASQVMPVFGANNRLRNNTANYVGFHPSWNSCPGDIVTAQTDAEEFVDAASNNFALKAASKATGAGVPPYTDIGCWQRKEGSGGRKVFVM